MLCLYYDDNAEWIKGFHDGIGNLRCHAFLYLRTTRKSFYAAGKFR